LHNLRIIGDIDDLQSIIKHINDEDEVLELQYKVNQVNNSRLDSLLKSKNEKLMKNMRHFNKEESEAYNKLYKSKSKVIKKDVFVGVNLDVKFDAKKYIDLGDLVKPEVDKYLDSKPEMTENDLKELEKL